MARSLGVRAGDRHRHGAKVHGRRPVLAHADWAEPAFATGHRNGSVYLLLPRQNLPAASAYRGQQYLRCGLKWPKLAGW